MILNLSDVATQAGFATIVGTTQPAIQTMVARGILTRSGTYGEWLNEYCARLRSEASGRAADNSGELTQARIEESRENTLSKRQERLTKAGVLVIADDVAQVIEHQAQFIKSNFLNAGDRIVESIASKYEIDLDSELVYEPLRNSLGHLADTTREFVEGIRQGTLQPDPAA
jgi:hypothetical protein